MATVVDEHDMVPLSADIRTGIYKYTPTYRPTSFINLTRETKDQISMALIVIKRKGGERVWQILTLSAILCEILRWCESCIVNSQI